MPVNNKVQLITYVDRLAGEGLSALGILLSNTFKDLFGGVHLLPFYETIDREDAGFDPIDHCQVDKRLGGWDDIKKLSGSYDLMADLIINHISSDSPQFQDYLDKGNNSKYAGMFLRYQDVFPTGATDEDLSSIYRPRPGLPFTSIKVAGLGEELFWTTFASKQIDINIFHHESKQYIDEIINCFKTSGVDLVRLDAVGYAVKKAGTSCFMTNETLNYIAAFSKHANTEDMEVLVELHSHYSTQIEIAEHVDKVYDFALPPLVLHTLYTDNASALKEWLKISPRNCISVLDTHDGIGIIDIAPGDNKPGLLNNREINFLIEEIHQRSNGESRKSTGKAANNIDLYQINCTFYSALGKNDNDYLLARLIQFLCPGVPQIYYVGLLAGENDMHLLEQTKVGRDVNRHYYSESEIDQEIQREVVKNLFALIRFRNNHPAFQGEFFLLESDDDCLAVSWSTNNASLMAEISFSEHSFSIASTINGVEETFAQWNDFERLEMCNVVNMGA